MTLVKFYNYYLFRKGTIEKKRERRFQAIKYAGYVDFKSLSLKRFISSLNVFKIYRNSAENGYYKLLVAKLEQFYEVGSK